MNIVVTAYKFGTEEEIGAHLGTYHYFIEKMRRVAARGHRVVVVAPWLRLTHRGSKAVDGIELRRYWPPMLPQWWLWPLNRIIRWLYTKQTQRQVLSAVKEIDADIVYVWQARETGYAVAQIKQFLPCPFIFRQITAWKWHFERLPADVFEKLGWYKFFKRLRITPLIDPLLAFLLDTTAHKKFAKVIYEQADRVVLLSRAAAREAEEYGLDRSKAEVLGVAIEDDIFKPMQVDKRELGLKPGPAILFIGRINFAEKGIGVILEAMPRIIEKIPDAQLVIIGGGEIERVHSLIRSLSIERNVQVLGKKPFQELPKFINASDALVTPSLWMEAFGQVTIEAMACGVPVATSDAGASPEINIDGETGLVVPAGDSRKLAQALVRILVDSPLRKKMGEAARKRVEEHYTYSVMVPQFLRIVEKTIASVQPPRTNV